MRKEKNFEDSDLQSYAEGMMCAIEMDANQARARAMLRTVMLRRTHGQMVVDARSLLRAVRAFHLTEDEIIEVVKKLKAKRLLPRDFHFNTEGVKFDD